MASSRVGANPRGHGLGGGAGPGRGGGAELQQDPQIGRFLIKEQLNERKTHKVRKLLGCFSSAAKRNPFNESERGRGRGRDGDQTGTAPPGLGAASLLLLLLVLQEERRPVTAGSVAPVLPPLRRGAGLSPCPSPAVPRGASPTSVMPRMIRSSRKMLTKSRKRSTQCLRGRRDALRGARPVPSPLPSPAPTRCNPCPRSPPSR